jgi:hypothetical protein
MRFLLLVSSLFLCAVGTLDASIEECFVKVSYSSAEIYADGDISVDVMIYVPEGYFVDMEAVRAHMCEEDEVRPFVVCGEEYSVTHKDDGMSLYAVRYNLGEWVAGRHVMDMPSIPVYRYDEDHEEYRELMAQPYVVTVKEREDDINLDAMVVRELFPLDGTYPVKVLPQKG